MTIGSGATINTAGTANINYLQGNSFVNAGHINVGGSGAVSAPPGNFDSTSQLI